MYFEEFFPNPRLRPFIRSYFYIRVEIGQFHFPADGCPGFIINFGDPFLLGFKKDKLDLLTGCRLFGSSTRSLMTRHTVGQTELLAVKYRPGQLRRFFDLPAIELTDTSVSLRTLCGKDGRELEAKLCEPNDIANIIGLLEEALVNCLTQERGYDDRISMALDTIARLNGQVRIDDLANGLDLGRRHFERRFLDFVGLTPKRMCRIARFLNVFSCIQTGQRLDWSDLAIASGYSDQAHLIRECKYFTGHSPLTYLKDRSSIEHTILGTPEVKSHFFNTTDLSSGMMP